MTATEDSPFFMPLILSLLSIIISAAFLLLHILPWSRTYDWLTLHSRILLYFAVIGSSVALIWVLWAKHKLES